MRQFLLILVSLLLCSSATAAPGPLLAVFAHPDDESATIGPLLSRYAIEVHDFYLIVVTSGQVGDSNTDIPRGDELGAVREKEARCSCKALGIHEPFLLQFMDGSIADWETIPKIRERVRKIIEEVKPEVIITWGPDGLTGHPDHRTVSSLTTEIFQQRSKLTHRPSKLYYVAYPESSFANLPPGMAQYAERIGLVADEWVTTVVDASAYQDQAWNSIQCHKTQWPPQMMAMIRSLGSELLGGKVYLRLALQGSKAPGEKEQSIFD